MGIWAEYFSSGCRPRLGLNPTSPVTAAGIRMDPPPSFACAIGSAPAATSDAEPPDEPPLVRSVSHGLRVTSPPWRSVAAVQPNGGMAVVPIGLSPVARSSGA